MCQITFTLQPRSLRPKPDIFWCEVRPSLPVFVATEPDIFQGKSSHLFGNRGVCFEGDLWLFSAVFVVTQQGFFPNSNQDLVPKPFLTRPIWILVEYPWCKCSCYYKMKYLHRKSTVKNWQQGYHYLTVIFTLSFYGKVTVTLNSSTFLFCV